VAADPLFIRLGENGAEASWATFAPTGQLTSSIVRGPLAEARSASEGRRVVVLVPGLEVIMTQAELPAASQARLRQIVPFSLEDSLADDIEGLAFAIGARLPSGAATVAVVAKARLEAWLADLAAAGIVPQAVYSETEGVPDVPGTLMLLCEGSRIHARSPDKPAVVLEGVTLRQAIDLLKADADEPKHAVAYVDPAARSIMQAELGTLPDRFSSAEAKLAPDGLFPHFAATLAQRSGTNLLQGSYAPKSNWIELARPWRFAASLLLAAGVLMLVVQGAQYWALRRADAALDQQLTESCQRLFGVSRASACDAEIQKVARTRGSASSETFLSTLAAVAEARDQATRIDALSYRNRVMDLQLVAGSVDDLDAFARTLEQTKRFTPKIESANQSDTGVEGRLQISVRP
jgi:general secretion pathway protein L